jgi:hypothetical protein
LAGFTNQKKERQLANGLQRFVRLRRATAASSTTAVPQSLLALVLIQEAAELLLAAHCP